MNPQSIIIALYGLTQLGQTLLDVMKRREGLTDEELVRLWEAQRAEFDAALSLWRSPRPGDGNI